MGIEVSVGAAASVGVSTGATVSVNATVTVRVGDATGSVAVAAGTAEVGVEDGGGSTGDDWNSPVIAAESVPHSIAASTSDASRRGLILSIARISCRARRARWG